MCCLVTMCTKRPDFQIDAVNMMFKATKAVPVSLD